MSSLTADELQKLGAISGDVKRLESKVDALLMLKQNETPGRMMGLLGLASVGSAILTALLAYVLRTSRRGWLLLTAKALTDLENSRSRKLTEKLLAAAAIIVAVAANLFSTQLYNWYYSLPPF